MNIVSGALNNAAAKKYDLEAWFPASKVRLSAPAPPVLADVGGLLPLTDVPRAGVVLQLHGLPVAATGGACCTDTCGLSPLLTACALVCLQVRCGAPKKGETKKAYVHLLNRCALPARWTLKRMA